MKDKLKSSEVEKLKSQSLSAGKTEPFNSSTLQPFNQTEKVYRQCLKRELDRERKWRNSEQGAFEASMLSLDRIISRKHCRDVPNSAADDCDFAVDGWQSDGGKGMEAVIRYCDGELGESYYQRRIKFARRRLARYDRRLLEVFDLIMKNGKNREESICQMALKIRPHGRRRKSDTGTTEKKS